MNVGNITACLYSFLAASERMSLLLKEQKQKQFRKRRFWDCQVTPYEFFNGCVNYQKEMIISCIPYSVIKFVVRLKFKKKKDENL